MRERLKLERRGFADHCRVDATGDRVHALPEITTRPAFAESRAADSPHAIYATGRTGRKFPETSPAQARMQSTDGTGHCGRVRGVAEQLPRFLRNFAEGAEDQAADRADRREPQLERSFRRASEDWNVEDWNVFLYRVLCDSMYHPDGT